MSISETGTHRPILRRLSPVVILLAAMWLIHFVDFVLPFVTFTGLGLLSWSVPGMLGILTAPLLHAGWPHLLSNTVPFLILGALICWESGRRFWTATAIIALVGGLGTWLVAVPGTLTVGASGLVFGYFAYLIARAFFAPKSPHRLGWLVLAVILGLVYGGAMLQGLAPWQFGVSWQGHLFGAIGGVVAAWLLYRRSAPKVLGAAG
ncbi:rhomboid family intramembrane serine protease [Saxibacter everestensis]|uniref:Rhomboid family intramembrane serine protease n=1 Tax=Saxibacter everestensis TaxID=2909229 RepID=A0ABY8QP97_9MICO|nr:rhomboid family intramembrane serine protease [Brevibacteriaceae bacterium ZFBP1038]